MSTRNKLARYAVLGFAFLGAFWLFGVARHLAFGTNYGEVITTAVSIDGALKAYVTDKSGFGAITPNITRVVIAERDHSVGDGQSVLHGSNLSGIKLRWLSNKRLQIYLPCSRFRSQNYYSNANYSRNVEIIVQTPDPICWNTQK